MQKSVDFNRRIICPLEQKILNLCTVPKKLNNSKIKKRGKYSTECLHNNLVREIPGNNYNQEI